MKATKYLLALLAFTSFSSLAAIEITREEAAKHTEIGPVTISQDGDDTVGIDHARLSKAVDEKAVSITSLSVARENHLRNHQCDSL